MTSTPITPSPMHFLSDILIFFIVAFHLLLPAQPEKLDVTLNPVTTESAYISFEIKNKTNRPVGRPTFYFEKNVGGEWKNAGFEYAVTEEGYTILPSHSKTEGAYINNPENVTPGEYRLTVIYRVGTGINSTSKQQKTIDFTVN